MSANDGTGSELRFSPDFAVRVLREADATTMRRRRVRIGGTATLVVAFAAAVGIFRLWGVSPGNTHQAIVPGAATFDGEFAATADAQSPMDYMFPDAAPLARFSQDYSDTASGGAIDRRELLFNGDAEQVAGGP